MKYLVACVLLLASACNVEQPRDPQEPLFLYPFESWADIDGEYFTQNCGRGSYSEETLTQITEWYEHGIEILTDELSTADLQAISSKTHMVLTKQFQIEKGQEYRRIKNIFNKLKSKAPKTYKPQLEVYLLSSNMVYNAFAAPGGKCYITTALLRDLQNEDELAFVLAHEIAHQIKDHGNLTMRQHKFLLETLGETRGEITNILLNFLTRPFSISAEYEADQGGLWLMSQAGFNPEKGLLILSRWVDKEEGTRRNSFFHTHPAAYKRFGCCSTLTAEAKERGEMKLLTVHNH